MRNFYYMTINNNKKHYYQRLDEAKQYHEYYGGKLYAVTKDLFPTKVLLAW